MKAPQCAGVIHTDFERGFIRAETVSYDDLMTNGSMTAAKSWKSTFRRKRIYRKRRRCYALPF